MSLCRFFSRSFSAEQILFYQAALLPFLLTRMVAESHQSSPSFSAAARLEYSGRGGGGGLGIKREVGGSRWDNPRDCSPFSPLPSHKATPIH